MTIALQLQNFGRFKSKKLKYMHAIQTESTPVK